LKDRPKEVWAIIKVKKQQLRFNTEQKATNSPSDIADNNQTNQTGWSGAHVHFYQSSEMH
jgi:hypothetical protein